MICASVNLTDQAICLGADYCVPPEAHQALALLALGGGGCRVWLRRVRWGGYEGWSVDLVDGGGCSELRWGCLLVCVCLCVKHITGEVPRGQRHSVCGSVDARDWAHCWLAVCAHTCMYSIHLGLGL